jgi:hypothetical protein
MTAVSKMQAFSQFVRSASQRGSWGLGTGGWAPGFIAAGLQYLVAVDPSGLSLAYLGSQRAGGD